MASDLTSVAYLKSKNVPFSMVRLTSIPITAQDVERLYGCGLNQVLKTLVLESDKGPIIAVLQGNKKLDFNKLKRMFGCSRAQLAPAPAVIEITGYAIGSVSPFGIPQKVMKVMDAQIFNESRLNMGSGDQLIGLELTSSDLRAVWDGIIDVIS